MSLTLFSTAPDSLINLPIGISAINLDPDSWIPVGSFQIETGQTATVRVTQLQLLEINGLASDTCTSGGTNILVSATSFGGIAYLALGQASPDTRPLSQPYIDLITVPSPVATATTATAPIYASRDITAAITISTPGVYTYYLANNTTNRMLLLAASGVVTIDLGL